MGNHKSEFINIWLPILYSNTKAYTSTREKSGLVKMFSAT